MRIVVLIKQVPDTESPRVLDSSGLVDRRTGEAVLDQIDEVAVEVALRLAAADRSSQVTAVTMGPPSAVKALRTALAMGADRAVHVCDEQLAGSDAPATARVLAAALGGEHFDVAITGEESTDGRTGVLPGALAELLGIACLPSLETVEMHEGRIRGTCAGEFGSMCLSAATPALVSVTERTAEARFPTLRGIMSARRRPIRTLDVADLAAVSLPDTGASIGPDGRGGPGSVVLGVSARPPRAAGRRLEFDQEGVQPIVDFLASRHLT